MKGNSKIPSREEMIEMAVKTRTQVTSANVSQEELEQFPAVVEKLDIQTRYGMSANYFTTLNSQHKSEITPLIINMHGGGFIRERTSSDDLFCRKVANATNCKILDIDYLVAPEYPFPTAVYECYDVILWAFKNHGKLGIDPNKIFLAGHSAGGNLVAGISILLEENKEEKPIAVIMDYPPLDFVVDPGEKISRGKVIPVERARLYNLYYLQNDERANYLASPFYATSEQLTNFPKTLMLTGALDDLCTEAEEFALKLARVGTEVTLKRFMGASHGFTIYKTFGCQEGVDFIIRFIKNILGN